MNSKRKKHEVTPIGIESASAYINEQLTAKKSGRRMGVETSRSLTLILAYGVDAITSNKAANDSDSKDQTAVHQLKWKAIERIKQFIDLGHVKAVDLTPTVTVNGFYDISADIKYLSKCSDRELSALKAVVCFGAPIDEIESFCGVEVKWMIGMVSNLIK